MSRGRTYTADCEPILQHFQPELVIYPELSLENRGHERRQRDKHRRAFNPQRATPGAFLYGPRVRWELRRCLATVHDDVSQVVTNNVVSIDSPTAPNWTGNRASTTSCSQSSTSPMPKPPRVADEAGYVVTLHTVYAHTRGVNDRNRLICHSGVEPVTGAYDVQSDLVRAYDCGLLRMIG